MIKNQIGRLTSASRTPNIGPKIPSHDLPNVQSLNRVVDAKHFESERAFKSVRAGFSKLKVADVQDSVNMMKKGSKMKGSMAGYKGGRSSWIQMNGAGYMGASRATRKSMSMSSASAASLVAPRVSRAGRVGGRFATSSKGIMDNILKLGKLV